MIFEVFLELFRGFGATMIIFFATIIFAVPLGLLVSLGSMCKFKPLSITVKTIVWIIRGTPLMLQIFVMFYLVFATFSSQSERIIVAVITFSINYAAYFSEIFRGGIEGIPRGQYEAAAVLGMSKTNCFIKIILPQAFKRVIPPFGGEIITLVKDTALANVIGVVELLSAAKGFQAQAILWPFLVSGLFYLVFNGIMTVAFNMVEKKLAYYR